MSSINGYIVNYSIKHGWSSTDAWEDKKALMTQAQLVEILTNKPRYMVRQATFTPLEDYRANFDPATYEDMAKGADA